MYKMLGNSLRNGHSKRTDSLIEFVRHQARRNLHVPTCFRGSVHAAAYLCTDSSLTATLVALANCFCSILYTALFYVLEDFCSKSLIVGKRKSSLSSSFRCKKSLRTMCVWRNEQTQESFTLIRICRNDLCNKK